MTMIKTTDDLLSTIEGIDRQALAYEHRQMLAIREWAFDHIGIDYRVGDRVRIKDGYRIEESFADGTPNGWWPYRDCLVPGALATVQAVDFNSYWKYWYADIILDREFAWSSYLGRHHWNGPVGETPEGMEPPSKYEIEHHPEGRRHTFAFAADMLAKATLEEDDHAG